MERCSVSIVRIKIQFKQIKKFVVKYWKTILFKILENKNEDTVVRFLFNCYLQILSFKETESRDFKTFTKWADPGLDKGRGRLKNFRVR